jgi:hypothetical protein
MPHYRILIENVSDTIRKPGWSQTEYCTAPDPETVNKMVIRDMSRFVDPSLYKWTITETPTLEG